jgi:hypothetical protein
MECLRVAAMSLAAATMLLGGGLVAISLHNALRGLAVLPNVRRVQAIAIFVVGPALLVVTLLDSFGINPAPGFCVLTPPK